ncbi:hypothetical protein K8F61_17170 [Microbacterium resistens]|uniref:Uncharacterized protein n=1 Tax=Microbacterium resistens TaxID=156977 RepID=A0ABY3RUE8_9MICO|nr:hypothetical protein [Microbacterium resistens]UGS26336.1 hypothetical protein K8F61_17170 [Microbacterium resistens]
MNKIIAQALNERAAVHGHRVLVVSATSTHARHALDELEAAVIALAVRRITRANGRLRIGYLNGGSISVVSAGGRGGRGLAADTVFVEWEAERRYPHLMEDLLPCIQASPHGEVIRA